MPLASALMHLDLVIARWGARLSAILIRGNAAVVRAGGGEQYIAPHVDFPGAPSLQHLIPEDDCAYELLGMHTQGGGPDAGELR